MLPDDVLNLNEFISTSSEEFVVLPGPDDILIFNTTDELYKQSVTLTARMWPPIEAGPKVINYLGLPLIFWALLIGIFIIVLIISSALFIFCWVLPRKRKFLSSTKFCATSPEHGREIIMAHRSSLISKPGQMIIPIGMAPPTYAPPPQVRLSNNPNVKTNNNNNNSNNNNNNSHYQYQQQIHIRHQQQQQHQYLQQQQQRQQLHYQHSKEYPISPACVDRNIYISSGAVGCGVGGIQMTYNDSKFNIPDTHKSMWAVNPLYGSNSILYENDAAYKSRSLPSYRNKQRPISNADDIEELYAKVNFSKKRRNRMRNGEAAIIALCRSRSQNLQGLALEREGVVIFDERTSL